jgi:predicted cupin superfamily sugar epimerase
VKELIESLGLEPHPEGGYYRRTYTSPVNLVTPSGSRPSATSIFYLMTREQPLGRLHRNRSDILHYLLEGGPVEYLIAGTDGQLHREVMGPTLKRVLLVQGGQWKASELKAEASHALIAEMVTPGFDFADHEFAAEADLHGSAHLETLRPFLTRRDGPGPADRHR